MSLGETDVLILCGGKGTRLASVIGHEIPKALAPINGKPFLDHLIKRLKKYGARRFILSAGHLSDQLERWWRNTTDTEIEVFVSIEKEQRGTGMAVRNCLPYLKSDPVMIVNGDTFNTADMTRFLQLCRRYTLEAATLHSVIYGRHNRASSGYYLLSQRLLQEVPPSRFEYFMARHSEGLGEVDIWRSTFLDIGTPKGYARAPEFLEMMNAPDWVPDAIRA